MPLIHADKNEPSDCSQTFNDKSLFVEYSDIIDTNKTIQNCVALKQGLLFEHGLTVAWNGVLSVYVVTTDHSKAILDLTYHSALPIIQGSLGFQRLILSIDETITKRRLPHPYPSNCTFGKGIENFFSTSYDQQSCIQSCFMRQMFHECHAVVDRWKPFMTA